VKSALGIAAVALLALSAGSAGAQTANPTAAPNPYRPDDGWAKPALGRGWGSNVKDGKVTAFIPESVEIGALEGVAADDAGNVYAGYTGTQNFRRFVKK